jgi:threonine dehydrogenase-like Zn-dependent dehydrogenase
VGVVTEVGADVADFHVGDRAAVGCMVGSCGECEDCQAGLQQYCHNGVTWTYDSGGRAAALLVLLRCCCAGIAALLCCCSAAIWPPLLLLTHATHCRHAPLLCVLPAPFTCAEDPAEDGAITRGGYSTHIVLSEK